MSSSNLLQSQSHSSPSLLSPSAAASASTTKSSTSTSSSSSTSLLKIRPREVVFHPPFQGFISNQLKLYNQSEHILAYKVKTTAPVRYCVRPNTGIIPPGESIDVQILLNCTKDVPSISMKTKDKFQIQSTIVSELNTDPKLIWSTTSVNQIMKQRLKAVFTLPNHTDSDHQVPQTQQQSQHPPQHLHANDMSSVVGENNNVDSDSADEVAFDPLLSEINDNSTYISTIGTSPLVQQLQQQQSNNTVDSKSHSQHSESSTIKKRTVAANTSSPSADTTTSPKSNSSTFTNTSTSNTSAPSTTSAEPSKKDTDYFLNENIQLTNQIKQMLNKIEVLESKVKNNQTIEVKHSSEASISNVKLLVAAFIISVISFLVGRMIAA